MHTMQINPQHAGSADGTGSEWIRYQTTSPAVLVTSFSLTPYQVGHCVGRKGGEGGGGLKKERETWGHGGMVCRLAQDGTMVHARVLTHTHTGVLAPREPHLLAAVRQARVPLARGGWGAAVLGVAIVCGGAGHDGMD